MRCDSSSERLTYPTRHLHPDFSIDSTRRAGSPRRRQRVPGRRGRPGRRTMASRTLAGRRRPVRQGLPSAERLPELVPAEVDKARRLLDVERIDVFVLHRDEPSLPVAAFADALLEQVAAERIGGFGVSNWTVPRLRELQRYLDRIGEDGLVVFSNHFSLAEMVAEPWPGCLAVDKEELLALADTDLLILAWSSLATGFFAGRDPASWDSPATARGASGRPSSPKSSGPQPWRSRSRTSCTSRTTCSPSSGRSPRTTSRGDRRRRARVELRAARVAGERRTA